MKNIILLLIVLIGVFVPKAYSQTYNMSSTTVNTCSGTFYDPGGTANYGNSQNYTMTFCSSTPGDEIQISFSSFDIESGWDYLTVNDGASSIQYTGTNSPGVVTSTGGCITFTFTSDGSVTYPGWVASISCVPSGGGGGGGNVVMTSGTWNGCSGTFMDPGGTGNYANSQNITMTLCSDQPGQQISLDFTTFNIESNFDYLYIDDGSGALQYTGSTLPPLVTSLNGCITLQFTSDGSVTYAGWEATIYCGTPSCTDGIQNQGETGIDCGGPNCAPCPDCYNGIQDGNETGIDCGGTCPTPCSCYDGIQNNGETDIDCGGPCNPCPVPCNVTATYTIGGPQPPVLDYNMSNGTISTCSGTFYDPGGTGNYANSTSLITQTFCSDQPGEQIILDFTGLPFQVETSFDFLNIYDGVGTGGTNLWNSQTQGGSTNPGVIQSTTGCLTITFSSDGSVTYSGWQAAISCTNPPLPMLDCNGGDITLVAEGQGEYNYLMNNDFNSGSGQGWNYTGGATFSQPCGPGDGSPYYWASTTTGTPQLTTVGFDVSCGGQIVFDMAYATQGGASPCEGPDLPNEGVTLQYSTDGGTTWTVIQYWDPLGGYDPNLTTWNTYTIPIPPGAVGPNTMFEWIQTNSSGTCCDNWGVDNVQIQAPINCAPYVYDWWQVPGGNNNPSQTETVTSTTTFNVTYTNGTDSCSTSVTVVVPPGTTADAGPDQTLCYGSAGVTIGGNPVSPDEGATYSWDNGAGSGTVDLTNPGIDNGQVVVSPAVTTTYILTVTFNGCTTTDTVTVYVDMPPTASNPPNINVECTADIPAPDPTVVTDEADDYTIPPTVTWLSDVSDGLSCPETITRTYRVTDGCGNYVDVMQLIIVNDITPPVLAAAPGPVTVECIGDVPAMTNLNWTDNCDGTGSVAGTDGALTGGPCGGTITRTWTYTDACGNTTTATQTITVNDQTAPVFAAPPGNVTVECIGDVPAMTNLNWTDNCDGTGSVAGTDGALTGGPCGGTITRTWTYTDACGNNATVTQTITVNDQTAPVFAAPPADVTVECIGDVPAMINLTWTDNCDGTGSVAGTDGALTGGSCGGTITRTWTYTDACGNNATVTQTITVNDQTAPVFAAPPANVTVECIGDVPAMTNLTWTDNCDGTGSVAGTDGALTGGSCGGTITRTWTYTDACGNNATVTQTITVNDQTAPVFAAPPATVTVECSGDVPAMTDLGWTDNCDGSGVVTGTDVSDGLSCPETITRTWTYTDACGNTASVSQTIVVDDTTPPTASNPTPLSIPGGGAIPGPDPLVVTDEADNCTTNPTVVWVSDVSDNGNCPETITRTYSITDDCGNQTLVTQTITIGDAVPPTASNPADINVECAADVPAPDPLVVTDEADNGGVPTVTFVSDVSDGLSCPETITRTYQVTDNCGNFIYVTQNIIIQDITPPAFTVPPADITVECIGDVPAMTNLTWTDNCDGTGSVAGTDGALTGGSCGGTITRTWTYTDACGNNATVTQTITVNDQTAPVFAAPPAAVTVECIGDVPAMTDLSWTDNCDGTGVVTGTDGALTGGSCGGTITRTWTYTDACGNNATVTQTITVNDQTAPVFAAPPATVTVECSGDVPAMTDLGWTDNCDGSGVVTGTDVSDGLSCPETITRTWTYTDACGNTASVSQTIVVDDTTPPTASNPATTTVPGGPAPAPDPNVVIDEADNCTTNPVVAFVSEVSDNNPCPETITRTYSVTDDCGNQITVTHTILITDPFPPTGTAPADITVECIGDVPPADPNLITDEADNNGVPTVAWVGDVSDGLSCPETITRTYSITDACGNVVTVDQLITVIDQTAPVMAAPPAAVAVECIGDVPAMTDLGWTDNCDGSGVVTGADVSDGLSCPETITRTWTYTDACGNTASVSQTITVMDITAPVFAAPPANVTVECIGDVPAMTDLSWTDNCDGTGVVTGTDGALTGGSCGGTITRTWTYTDACGNNTTVTQTITVNDQTAPVFAAPPATVTVECSGDVPAMTDLGWTDNCDGSGVVTGTDVSDGLSCPETITRTWTYTDACGNTASVSQTIVVDDTTPPTASNPATTTVPGGPAPAPDPNVVIDEADNCTTNPVVAFVSEVSDNNPCPETITRTYSITDDCGNVSFVTHDIVITDPIFPTGTAPANITVECIGDVPPADPNLITDEADNQGTPTVAWVGDVSDGLSCPETITRTYSITDICGNEITVDQLIVVNDTTDPTASNPVTINVECIGDVPVADINAVTDEADNCTVNPTVAWVGDVSDGLSCPETITRTFSVTDDCGNQITVDQLIIVNDITNPTASNPTTINVECIGDVPVADINAVTDEADNCTVNPTVAWVGDVSDGLSCPETITRTFSVTDDCGNSITVDQLIIVNDVTAPTASNPTTVNVECIGDVPAVDINVVTNETDNCTVNPIVAWVGDVSDGLSCPETITRTYSVTDDCGNQITVDQLIIVNDVTDPTASNPVTVNVECIADVPAVDINVVTNEADNCTANPVVAWVGDVSDGLSCPETITRTYSVTDDCGNQITVDQLIIVNDITDPTASNPLTVNVQCIGDVPAADINAVTDEADNCTVNPTVAWVGDISDGQSCPETITRTFSVTDDCGNQITVDQLIIVNDTIAPTASNPTTVNVECIGDVPASDPLVVTNEADNCTVNPVVAWVSDVSDGLSCPETITRTYSITDDCGNQTLVTQLIVVNDVTPPTASNPAPVSVPGAMDVPAPDPSVVDDEADNCTTNPVVTWVSDVSDGNVCNNEVITRTYSVVDDCGNETLVTQEITILAVPPPIDAGPDQLICIGESVTLTADNPWNVPITWDNGVQDGVQFSPTGTMTYTVTADNLGCISTDQVVVTVEDLPVVSFMADVTSGCEPLTVTFTNTSTASSNFDNCIWEFGDGGTSSGCGSVSYTYTNSGLFDVTLTTTTVNGCSNSITYDEYIYVEEIPIAAFTASQTELSTIFTEVHFENNSQYATDYTWNFGDMSPISTEENPTHSFPDEESGAYVVQLIATSPLGCADTAYTTIIVNEEIIFYVPNTFTPDDDTYNETFKPVFTSGYDPYDFTLLIFNRWGEIIWESHNAAVGWDGTYGGEVVQDGTYTWRIEFKTTMTDERKLVTGHVNVIR